MQRPKPDPPLTSGAERMTPRRHVGRRSPQLGLARGIEASPANSDKSRSATRRLVSLGYTVDGLPAMETSVRAVDEAVLGRLRLFCDRCRGWKRRGAAGWGVADARRYWRGRRVCPWPALWRRSVSGSGSVKSPSQPGRAKRGEAAPTSRLEPLRGRNRGRHRTLIAGIAGRS